MKEIGLETDFRNAFMNVTRFLQEANLPIDIVYENKKPNGLPENISRDWDTIQEYYRQEEQREKESGDIILS